MRYEAVERRLAHVPRRLPAGRHELMPEALPEPDGSPPPAPRFPAGPRRQAAVLILVHPDEHGEAMVVLTKRAAGSHRHAGQVAFPGGALEAGEDPAVGALREAAEEVGLDAAVDRISVVATLAPVDVPVSGFLVHLVIATAAGPPHIAPDGHEVVDAFSAPLGAFLPSAPIETVTERRDGFRLRYGAFRAGEHIIWGATAGQTTASP